MTVSPNAILEHLDALVFHASEVEGRKTFTGLEVMNMAKKAVRHASEETEQKDDAA